ncbi:MAG: hypothetical protein EKK33_15370 [Bradyrhizobiaceae bacterium]|nr:MAG: hypothetical protein EKK33_15370 [Bradyrhizobiaceae bacterium]
MVVRLSPLLRSRLRPLHRLGVGAEQRQQKRDFFLRTDLDHDDLLFAGLVGAGGKGVQDNRVSRLFQLCFVGSRHPRPPACVHICTRPAPVRGAFPRFAVL